MKYQGTLALFLIGFAVFVADVAAVTLASTEASVERAELLDGLGKAETLTGAEQQTLRSQQEVLVELAQEQGLLESKVNALEASELAMSSPEQLPGQLTTRPGQKAPARPEQEHPEVYLQQPRPQVQVVPNTAPHAVATKNEHHLAQQQAKKGNKEMVVLLRGVESKEDFMKEYNQMFWNQIASIAAYLLQVFIAAMLYMQFCKQSVTPKIPDGQVRTDDFQYSCLDTTDCARDCQLCMCGICCPWIRWSESASKDYFQFLAFIPALFISALLASAGPITFGASELLLLIIVVICRQRIRDLYGLESGSCQTISKDCLLWCCCPCLAIIQEARQLDFVEPPMQDSYTGLPNFAEGP